MSELQHLVSVWNPAVAADAMEAHLAILLGRAGRVEGDPSDRDDVYVWWGKIRSPNRQQAQAHLEDIRRLGRELKEGGRESLDLYLTDYQSLYAAEVLEILEGDLPDDEEASVPGYYAEQELHCDFWFCVGDIRRLVSDDMLEVIAALRQLRNVNYHDRPVSLFGGMVNLPLVVTRPDGQVMFERGEREAVAGQRLWAQFDAEQAAGTAAMERELRDNVLGEKVWRGLHATARTCLAGAEKIFRERRNDPGFDFAPVIIGFAKALEIQTNAVIRHATSTLPDEVRRIVVDDHRIDLARTTRLTIGQAARVIANEREVAQALGRQRPYGLWLSSGLAPVLEDFRPVRNCAAHQERIDRQTATAWRNRILGVGNESYIAMLSVPAD